MTLSSFMLLLIYPSRHLREIYSWGCEVQDCYMDQCISKGFWLLCRVQLTLPFAQL